MHEGAGRIVKLNQLVAGRGGALGVLTWPTQTQTPGGSCARGHQLLSLEPLHQGEGPTQGRVGGKNTVAPPHKAPTCAFVMQITLCPHVCSPPEQPHHSWGGGHGWTLWVRLGKWYKAPRLHPASHWLESKNKPSPLPPFSSALPAPIGSPPPILLPTRYHHMHSTNITAIIQSHTTSHSFTLSLTLSSRPC